MSMREANQSFSAAAAHVAESGEELIITNRGKPYVKVVQISHALSAEQRQDKADKLRDFLSQFETPLGLGKFDREAINEEMINEKLPTR